MFDFELHEDRFNNNESEQAICAQLDGDGLVYSVVFNTNSFHQTSCVSQVVLNGKFSPIHGCGNIQGVAAGYSFSRNF